MDSKKNSFNMKKIILPKITTSLIQNQTIVDKFSEILSQTLKIDKTKSLFFFSNNSKPLTLFLTKNSKAKILLRKLKNELKNFERSLKIYPDEKKDFSILMERMSGGFVNPDEDVFYETIDLFKNILCRENRLKFVSIQKKLESEEEEFLLYKIIFKNDSEFLKNIEICFENFGEKRGKLLSDLLDNRVSSVCLKQTLVRACEMKGQEAKNSFKMISNYISFLDSSDSLQHIFDEKILILLNNKISGGSSKSTRNRAKKAAGKTGKRASGSGNKKSGEVSYRFFIIKTLLFLLGNPKAYLIKIKKEDVFTKSLIANILNFLLSEKTFISQKTMILTLILDLFLKNLDKDVKPDTVGFLMKNFEESSIEFFWKSLQNKKMISIFNPIFCNSLSIKDIQFSISDVQSTDSFSKLHIEDAQQQEVRNSLNINIPKIEINDRLILDIASSEDISINFIASEGKRKARIRFFFETFKKIITSKKSAFYDNATTHFFKFISEITQPIVLKGLDTQNKRSLFEILYELLINESYCSTSSHYMSIFLKFLYDSHGDASKTKIGDILPSDIYFKYLNLIARELDNLNISSLVKTMDSPGTRVKLLKVKCELDVMKKIIEIVCLPEEETYGNFFAFKKKVLKLIEQIEGSPLGLKSRCSAIKIALGIFEKKSQNTSKSTVRKRKRPRRSSKDKEVKKLISKDHLIDLTGSLNPKIFTSDLPEVKEIESLSSPSNEQLQGHSTTNESDKLSLKLSPKFSLKSSPQISLRIEGYRPEQLKPSLDKNWYRKTVLEKAELLKSAQELRKKLALNKKPEASQTFANTKLNLINPIRLQHNSDIPLIEFPYKIENESNDLKKFIKAYFAEKSHFYSKIFHLLRLGNNQIFSTSNFYNFFKRLGYRQDLRNWSLNSKKEQKSKDRVNFMFKKSRVKSDAGSKRFKFYNSPYNRTQLIEKTEEIESKKRCYYLAEITPNDVGVLVKQISSDIWDKEEVERTNVFPDLWSLGHLKRLVLAIADLWMRKRGTFDDSHGILDLLYNFEERVCKSFTQELKFDILKEKNNRYNDISIYGEAEIIEHLQKEKPKKLPFVRKRYKYKRAEKLTADVFPMHPLLYDLVDEKWAICYSIVSDVLQESLKISSHKIKIYQKLKTKIVAPIPFKDLWEMGVSEIEVRGRLFEPEEKKKIFNLNYYLKLRMPYKLGLADIPIQDDERGKIVGNCLMKMVDYIANSEEKIFENERKPKKESEEHEQNKREKGKTRLRENWVKVAEGFSLLKKDRVINSFQRAQINIEKSIQEEKIKQMERLKIRKKELQAIIRTNGEKRSKSQSVTPIRRRTTKVLRTKSYLEGLKRKAESIRNEKLEQEKAVLEKTNKRAESLKGNREREFKKFNQKQVRKFDRSFELIKQRREKEFAKAKKLKEKEFFRKGFISFNKGVDVTRDENYILDIKKKWKEWRDNKLNDYKSENEKLKGEGKKLKEYVKVVKKIFDKKKEKILKNKIERYARENHISLTEISDYQYEKNGSGVNDIPLKITYKNVQDMFREAKLCPGLVSRFTSTFVFNKFLKQANKQSLNYDQFQLFVQYLLAKVSFDRPDDEGGSQMKQCVSVVTEFFKSINSV